MQSNLEHVSIYVSEFEQMEMQTELSEGNGVYHRCGGIYGELERQNLSVVLRWTYSVRGIG